jgi:hypothetical protein
MSRQALTPDHLFDRPWRPGRCFAPARQRLRRFMMLALLALLCLIIGAYAYITDSERVRGMAQSYLSSLVGGPVEVGAATLSIFEGLRLDDVKVYVDDRRTSDSLLFSAQTFLIKYDPATMIAGHLEATEIVAQKPQVHLAENRDIGEWNYERLARRRRNVPAPRPSRPGKPMVLPQLKLRNARVSIIEIRGGHTVAEGVLAVDGSFAPAADPDRFAFQLQSRGVSEGLGPYASGTVSLSTGQVAARLMNFEFDRDVRSMLPADPREWWTRHELAGAVSMPEISFTPGTAGAGEQFKLVTVLNGVTLSVSPEEWMGRGEVTRLASMRETADVMGGLYRSVGADPTADRLTDLLHPSKITLKNVAGTFVFTNAGIELKDISGFVESNGLKIDGHIDGYRPDAPISLRLASFDTQNLTIPSSPRYINSLPPQVREVYEQFKPEGEARLALRVERLEAGARPEVSGAVQVLDGRFVFNRFPYPLRNVTGRIELGHSPDGSPQVGLDVRGKGIATGPNRDAVLEIKTFGDEIGPIGTNVCGVNVRISGTNVSSEDELRDAFPPEVRQALANFDAHHTGKYPQYRGDFVTEVVRPVGLNQRWSFDTDVTLTDASGALAAFPYPLHDVTGKLLIRSGYAQLVGIKTREGLPGGSLDVGGRVAWTTSDGPRGPQPPYHARGSLLSPRVGEAVTTDLSVSIRGMPIDNELLAAIPKDRREWVQKLGATGTLDVDGRIFAGEGVGGPDEDRGKPSVEWVVGGQPALAPSAIVNAAAQDATPPPLPASATSPVAYDLTMTVHDGTLRPFGRAFTATDVSAVLHLTPDRLIIEDAHARRAAGKVSARGTIDWPRGTPRVLIDGTAKKLPFDAALYELLPGAARKAWDETRPQGTANLELHYDSTILAERDAVRTLASEDVKPADTLISPPSSSPPTSRPSPGVRFTLTPDHLAMTLKTMPYKLEELTGNITVEDDRVTITDVTGRHGDGKVLIAGTGMLGDKPVWNMRLGGEKLPLDDALRKALPTTLAGLVQTLKLEGTVGFNFGRFVYRSNGELPQTRPSVPADTQPTGSEPDIDIAGSFLFSGAKLDVGVALADVAGGIRIDAGLRNGHLETLRGGIDLDTMTMAGRPTRNFRAELFKPAGKPELHIDKMRGDIAGGSMSGRMTLVYPDDGASRYALELVVRDADVRSLAWEKADDKMQGQLNASLSLEGSWGNAAQRRGRGDVMVTGRDMYRIPLVLGLLQVTNLALPISSPFNEATAVYNLDGNRVVFEQIKLSARNMLMEGAGSLDFGTKKVDLSFTTDNPSGLMQLPFLKELWSGARNEMLRIRVKGTIQEPEVSAQSMGTFWTTVDEVLNGGKAADDKKRNK